MNTYRYVATDILTGTPMADNIPLVVSSVNRAISGVGQLTGYLPLRDGSPFVRALVPDRTMLWMLCNGLPIWAGLFSDSDHSSIADHRLPVLAYTPEAILAGRQIRHALAFTDMDVNEIARGLVAYATGTTIGANAQLAGLMLGTHLAGVTDSQTFGVSDTLTAGSNTYLGDYTDNQQVSDALGTYADSADFEYTFEPRLNGGQLQLNFRIGNPALGQYNRAPVYNLTYPGPVADYARPIRRSASANDIQGSASPNGTGNLIVSQPGYGLDTADLAQGRILRQTAVTWPGNGPLTQAQLNQWTASQIARFTAGVMVPQIEMRPGAAPNLTQIGLGDALGFSATSDLDPRLPGSTQPGLQITARMVGWNLTPPGPDGQLEKLVYQLGALIGSTGIGGVGL